MQAREICMCTAHTYLHVSQDIGTAKHKITNTNNNDDQFHLFRIRFLYYPLVLFFKYFIIIKAIIAIFFNY